MKPLQSLRSGGRLVLEDGLHVLLEHLLPVVELEPVGRLVHQHALLGGAPRVLGREEEPRATLAFAPVVRIVRRGSVAGVADGVGARGARMGLVQAGAASGAVPAGLRAVMRAVRAGGAPLAHGVAAASATANHTPAWTASAAVRAVPVVPDVRPALGRLETQSGRWLVPREEESVRDATISQESGSSKRFERTDRTVEPKERPLGPRVTFDN